MQLVIRYLPVAIFFLVWEIVTVTGIVSRQLLPGLEVIFEAFAAILASGEFVFSAYKSLTRAAAGLGAAVVLGILIGLFMATNRIFLWLINPIVRIFYPMPKSALIPLVMIWFGLGDSSKVFLIFLGCLLPVIISTYNGARGVGQVLLWSASSLGASRFEILREVILPAALPDILAGCRTALAFSFILMVSSEFVIAKDGLGFLIATLGDGGNYPAMFAVILAVAGIGFAADRIYAAFAASRLHWKEHS
jgi:ABC-type nitrate/sulfonate/bicarbonate transport system permease component